VKTPDPQLRQEMLDTNHKKYEDAFNRNDAAASLVAFYTEDAVLCRQRRARFTKKARGKQPREQKSEVFEPGVKVDHLDVHQAV
jgi:ketosteroid isomerase-like protein